MNPVYRRYTFSCAKKNNFSRSFAVLVFDVQKHLTRRFFFCRRFYCNYVDLMQYGCNIVDISDFTEASNWISLTIRSATCNVYFGKNFFVSLMLVPISWWADVAKGFERLLKGQLAMFILVKTFYVINACSN